MTKIRILVKNKVRMGRTALYTELDFIEKLEALSEERGISLNRLCISLLKHGVTQLEEEAAEAAPKKTRKKR